MPMPRKTGLIALILTLLVTAASGCSRKPAGSLSIGLQALPTATDPAIAQGGGLLNLVYETLIARGPDGAYVPGLASAWSVSADGLTVSLTVRSGVKFADGRTLTASEAAASLERLRAADATALGPVTAIAGAGQMLTVSLSRPYPPLWEALAGGRAAIVRAVEGGALVGTGPYAVAEATGDLVRLTARPEYRWAPAYYRSRGPARVAEITLRAYPAPGALAAAIAAGQVDIASGLDLTAPAGWQTVTAPGQGLTYLGLNCQNGPLTDARVRRAIALLARTATGSAAAALPGSQPAGAFLPGGVWGSSAVLPSGDAAALLTEAGFVRGGDGIWQKQGAPLSLTIVTPLGGTERIAGEAVVATLRAAGLDAFARSEFESSGSAGDAFIGRFVWPQPDIIYYLLHTGAEANRFAFSDSRVDRLLEAAAGAMEPADRLSVYQAIQSRLAEVVPYVPLVEDGEQWVVRPGLSNVRATVGGQLHLLTVSGALAAGAGK